MPDNNTIAQLVTIDECDPYIPKAALVVFVREIRRDGSMAAAKPVSKEFVQNLLSGFSQEYRRVPHGRIPDNLIYCDTRRGQETYIWYNPPGKRNRFFDGRLGLEDGVYHVPGTLYIVKGGRISVFCFPGRKPAMDKPLLGVPYFNVYADGSVCMGNAHPNIPDTDRLTYEDIMKAWENAFWNSVDVHTNGSPSTKANLIETIKKYKDKPFDTKELETRKDNLTIESLIIRQKS